MPQEVPPTQWATGHAVPVGWMRQFRYFLHLYEKVRNIPGDIVECGVGEGTTFAMLAYFVGSEGQGRELWGFDSFEGFPEPSALDASSPRNPQKGEWKIEEPAVREYLKKSNLLKTYPDLSTTITPGFLRDTLPLAPVASIAFLHLDVDLEEGYRDGLEHLYDLVSPGGIVAFDEYREVRAEHPEYGPMGKWPGCTKAVDDFLATHPEVLRYWSETKKYYLVKGDQSSP